MQAELKSEKKRGLYFQLRSGLQRAASLQSSPNGSAQSYYFCHPDPRNKWFIRGLLARAASGDRFTQ